MGGDRGLTGLSALIIVTSVILVSFAAAFIIIVSSGSLQNRAIRSGFETQESVVSGVEVLSVMGTDGSEGKDIEHFEVVLRLQAGSNYISFNKTVFVVSTSSTNQQLVYNFSQGDSSENAATTGDYTVEYVTNGTDTAGGYLTRGDIVKVRFNYYSSGPSDTTGGVGEDEMVYIKVVPSIGNPTPVQFLTPTPINEMREQLYPSDRLL